MAECTDPNLANENEQNRSEEALEDFNFLNGIMHLNTLLVPKIDLRMPEYSLGRFADACLVAKAYPSFDAAEAEVLLGDKLDSNMLVTMIQASKALLSSSCFPSMSNMSLSSPWPSNKRPSSADECQNHPLKGKIYTVVKTRHTASSDDHVIVQETETRAGYISPVFSALATVAFPPICKGEVWTVGWIQALRKANIKEYSGSQM